VQSETKTTAEGPGPRLLPQHAKLIEASGVTPEVVLTRGYRSVTSETDLERLGFSASQRIVPGLLIPIFNVTGEIVLHQYRPDSPRTKRGKSLKYETPMGAHLILDVPPPARAALGDPTKPLFITEGARKADAAVSRGVCCISLLGVWGWRGSNEHGGKTALACWESIALKGRRVFICFDSDVTSKPEVKRALDRFEAFLEHRGAKVTVVYLPPGMDGQKVGLDDYFAAGHTVEELLALGSGHDGYKTEEPDL